MRDNEIKGIIVGSKDIKIISFYPGDSVNIHFEKNLNFYTISEIRDKCSNSWYDRIAILGILQNYLVDKLSVYRINEFAIMQDGTLIINEDYLENRINYGVLLKGGKSLEIESRSEFLAFIVKFCLSNLENDALDKLYKQMIEAHGNFNTVSNHTKEDMNKMKTF